MDRRWPGGIVFSTFLVLGLLPSPASAQPPTSDFGQLASRVRVGETVWVTGEDGREVQGKLWNLSASSLQVMSRGQATTFKSDSLLVVSARGRDSLANGALIGLVTGVVLGALVASVCEDDYWACFAGAGLVYGGFGSAIGVGVDAMTPGPKMEVYRRPAIQSARIRLAPLASPRAQGLVLRIAF
jgi:hypothetical protein